MSIVFRCGILWLTKGVYMNTFNDRLLGIGTKDEAEDIHGAGDGLIPEWDV